ncbi:protein kinase [Frankia sp. CNm7]|uniref:non-specific serine/threonine protein kinase n=1 Tax=Frankia nepalensis TaxID=1836974 RepID=A0A937RHE6_9ACTN|nr:protein kinase [Frankia nepalensis]MBL7502030.1 protein kinase [Frankia nepalensis]MBL7510294.1 protein kinase [Frankia nepalensis]MBL7517036.1 protein kinase [Frankia nepalensis]MBL7630425.1 protein kinase [Frankia nepalensis]
MADVVRLCEWGGPGEEATAIYLRDHLPASWTVVCGRQIVSGTKTRDSDFIAVGPSSVILIEEKSWHGQLSGTEERWYDRKTRKVLGSPVSQVNGVARLLAGRLEKVVPAKGRPGVHLVRHLVVLSSSDVQYDIADSRVADQVVRLVGCERKLLEIDKTMRTQFDLAPFRAQILALVTGLPDRPARPAMLGDYTIVEELDATPRGPRYVGMHRDGSARILLTYLRRGLSEKELAASDQEVLREYHAMRKLAPTGVVFRVDPYFGVDDDQMWVAPMGFPPPELRNLREKVVGGERPTAAVFTEVAAHAYEALAAVHDAEIVHRALHPSRIFIPETHNQVTFSDFLLAKFTGHNVTITDVDEIDDLGRPFRAPECRASAHAATERSDIYSLALCLLAWLRLDKADPDGIPPIPAALPDPVRAVLADCLRPNPSGRPTAHEAAEAFAGYLRQERRRPVRPTAGAKVDKYELVEALGAGASATTWLMIDRRMDIRHTLKIMHAAGTQDRLATELKNLHKLKHDRIVRATDYLLQPFGPALIAEYVAGQTVKKLAPTLRGNAGACLKILHDMLDALEYVHQRGVVHRDVSPNNIIVDADDRATLIDFGVASDAADRSIVGTLPYQAPEIAAGKAWTAAADLYSLAVVCFEALTGRLPYSDDGRSQDKYTLVRPTNDEIAAAGGLALLEVLLHGASDSAETRFGSAAAFRDALTHSLAQEAAAPVTLPDDAAHTPEFQRPVGPETAPALRINPTVDDIRQLFRNSRLGNSGNRGLDSPFADQTYVTTRLDDQLAPRIIGGRPRLVVFSGNPGDGKTAFLERLSGTLLAKGAIEQARDAAGWRIALAGHEFASVYDASESHEGLSADELLRRALDPLTDPARADRYTALIAANDGRILDFLEREAARYPEIAALLSGGAGAAAEQAGVLRIDLKNRSMASAGPAAGSLTVRMLDALLDTELWSTCAGCLAEPRCPIARNVTELRDAQVKDRLHRLVLTSHLRRGRRPTIRDLRSAIAYLVTADVGCGDVHREFEAGELSLATPDRHFSASVFDDVGGHDRLLGEWRLLDPGRVAAPRAERLLAPQARTADAMSRAKRHFYFTAPAEQLAAVGHLGPYRHLDTFTAILAGGPTDAALEPLLRGLSRCIGPVGYDGAGVAVSVGEPAEDGGAVVKILPATEFRIETRPPDDSYVEATADAFTLRHSGGQAALTVDIDLFELLMRAAAGYLPTNAEATPLLEELGLFRSRLTLQRAQKVIVIEPNGRRNAIDKTGTTIELLGAER